MSGPKYTGPVAIADTLPVELLMLDGPHCKAFLITSDTLDGLIEQCFEIADGSGPYCHEVLSRLVALDHSLKGYVTKVSD